MSGLIGQIINIRPQRSIGSITAQATIEERHTDELVVTDHPVEQGANISDHAFLRPAEVTIRCGWSNSGYGSLMNIALNAFSPLPKAPAGDTYVREMYQKLRELQGKRVPFSISTGKRSYKNMLLTSLSVTTDGKSENALMVTATCRQVIIVETQATKLPPKESQASPAKTAEPDSGGSKQLSSGQPSPGGASPPTTWGK